MDIQTALSKLHEPLSLSIISLAQPILDRDSSDQPKRNSNASDSSANIINTPALLSADLLHYRDLFGKLRFSYIEQVTKERFLRALTSDPPEFVDGKEIADLEVKLGEDKAALKAKKEEVGGLIRELEEQGRNLAESMCSVAHNRNYRDKNADYVFRI
jgi:hypothetical protein